MAVLANLESRIANGESYLANHPDDASAQALYWRLTAEYVDLWLDTYERETLPLELPPGIDWQRDKASPVHHTVNVVMAGIPHTDDDISKTALATLLEAMRLREEAQN